MANSYFNAFISYRHSPVDTAVAVEIQKKLERFHIPSQIQKKYGIKKFERIFRDTSELEITNDLGAQLDDAIRSSDFLIVICSPRYMESAWCLREIDVFLQTHPRDHVLCVLAEGEPPGIFPPVLMQEAEPLACDYRGRFREAEKVELPRLACAMIGCSYDELIMRTTQYKRRRTTALVSVILTFAAIAVSYLLYSNARIRAQYQQTLINESKTLAAQSLEAYAERDRYHALEYALQALPSEDLDRPVTSEAVYALHQAAEAYQVPYQITETRLFNGIQDFEKMVLLESSGFLAAMDSSGQITVFDPSSALPVSSFSAYAAGHATEVLPDLISTKDDRIFTAAGGVIHAFEPDGTLLWEQTVNNIINNYIRVSPDEALLGCTDATALQVMNVTDGEPVASYRIPDEISGYIRDFVWSPDGTTLAVQLRLENGNDRFGLIDVEHGGLKLIDGEFSYLAAFHFDDLNQLLIFCRPSDQSSYSSGKTKEYLVFQELSVFAYDLTASAVFDMTIPFSSESFAIESRIFYIGEHPILLLSASSCLSLLDPSSGEVLLSYDLGESIVRLIDANPLTIQAITSSGKTATVWYRQGESTLKTQFPEGITDVLIQKGSIQELDRFFLQKDGDILLFESAPDLSILLADEPNGSIPEIPENLVLCGESAVLKTGGDILFYHLPDLAIIGKRSYGDHKTIRLMDAVPMRDAVAVLVIDMDSGIMLIEMLDVMTGDLLASYRLQMSEYFYDSGILDLYASYYEESEALSNKRLLLESTYLAYSGGILLQNDILTYHSYTAPNTIFQLDLLHGKERSFSPNFSASQTLLNGTFENSLSPFLLSPDGSWIFSILQEEGHELRGVLLSTEEEGEIRILSETESSASHLAAWSQDSQVLAVTGASSLLFYHPDGSLTASIPYPGSRPLMLYFLKDGSLAALYPNGQLIDYASDGTLLHEVLLSYGDLSFVLTNSFHLYETNNFLVVLCQDQMELINLSSFDAHPAMTVPAHALAYSEFSDQILVYSLRYQDASMQYHLGAFNRYTLDELIQKGREALSSMTP